MKRILYRRIFIPSLVVVCSLFVGGWFSDIAKEFDLASIDSTPDASAIAAEPHPPGPAVLALGASDMCPPSGPGGPGVFPFPPGMGGLGMFSPLPGMGGPGMCPPPPGVGGPGMFPPPPGMGGPMMLPLGELDLSDDQVEKLAGLKATAMDKAGLVIIQMHSLEREFRTALVQSELNTDQLTKLQGQLSVQKQTLDAIFCNCLIASSQVLTSDQRRVVKQEIGRAELGPMVLKRRAAAEKK